jgi:hypothetical protein
MTRPSPTSCSDTSLGAKVHSLTSASAAAALSAAFLALMLVASRCSSSCSGVFWRVGAQWVESGCRG